MVFVQLVSINTTVVIRTPFMAKCTLDTTLCDKVAAGRWFSRSDTPVSSTNKADRHNIAEILLKVALKTINLTIIIIQTSILLLMTNLSNDL
jgi:hypothetical protein